MDTDQHVYRSYLLRLWRSKSDATISWYASLEDPVSGERKGFSNLKSMINFLEADHEDNTQLTTQTPEEQK